MTELSSSTISQRTRAVGCTINFLVWLLFASLCALVVLVVVPVLPPALRLPGLAECVLPILLLAGLVGALLIGLRFGPRWWPGYYARLASRPYLIAMLPGAAAACVTGLCTAWALAVYFDTAGHGQGGTGAGATLLVMFIFTPAILLIGPVFGAAGGLVAAYLATRFNPKAQSMLWLYGLAGGGVAGLAAGVLPYALIQLWARITGNPGF
jgi:hypothetical protein